MRSTNRTQSTNISIVDKSRFMATEEKEKELQGGEEVSMSKDSEHAGGVSGGVAAALASLWKESRQEESVISSQTGEFEVMKSKLQKISLTSKQLEQQASETAEDIETQERHFYEEGPPSVGDAMPSPEHIETE